MENKRPKIKLKKNLIDWILEIAPLLGLIIVAGIILLYFPKINEAIPIHFNAKGNADSFGSKKSIWILFIIALGINFALTVLTRYPQLYNYPVKIHPETAEKQYTLAVRFLRVINLIITVMFCDLIVQIIRIGLNEQRDLNHIMIFGYMIFTFILIFIYYKDAKRIKP